MDEPRVKYIPVDVIKEYFKRYSYIIPDFDDIVEKFGIDVIRYKNAISVSDQEMRAVKNSTDWMNVTDYVKEAAASNLEETILKHLKCTSKLHYMETCGTEYRYDIMIGEIPKWQQKGEEE